MHKYQKVVVFALLLGGVSGCGDAPLFNLKLVFPEGADPLASVDSIRLSVTNPRSVATQKISDPRSFSLELEVSVDSGIGAVTLEGFAGAKLVARGETPPMVLRPEEKELSLLVGAAGSANLLVPKLTTAAPAMASALAAGVGVVFLGGTAGSGKTSNSSMIYDFFQHKVTAVSPPQAGRSHAVSAACGQTCAVFALGMEDSQLATKLLRYDGARWAAFDDKLDAATRRHGATLASLGDGTHLVVGGIGVTGKPLDTLLKLSPGGPTVTPTVSPLTTRAKAARHAPAVALGKGAVVIAGGQQTGESSCELFYTRSYTAVDLTLAGTPPGVGTAAVALADGSVAVVGGQPATGTGAALVDGWIVVPDTGKVSRVSGALAEGRYGHSLWRLGDRIVVWGGTCSDGKPCKNGELLDAKTLKSAAKFTHLPRTGAVIQFLGRGSLLVAGGTADGTKPETRLEVFQTDLPET